MSLVGFDHCSYIYIYKFPRVLGSQDLRKKYDPNPKTNMTFSHLKMDGWKMILSFSGQKAYPSGANLLLVLGRLHVSNNNSPPPQTTRSLHLIKHNCWTPRHWWYSQGRCGWSAFCCLSLSSSENHGGWNHMLVRRKANILADCCKKSWTLYLQLVPSSYHWTFLLAWSWSQGCQGSVPLLYRCTQDLYYRNRNPHVGDSYWKLPRSENHGQTHIQTAARKSLELFFAQCSDGWRTRTEAGKVHDTFDASHKFFPWNLLGELPDCHPDTSKGGDLLRFDNSETLPSGKVT